MPAQKLTAKILNYLNNYPGASIKDLSLALGISASMTRAILYRLKSNGYIEKAGSGYYLTDKGLWLLNRMIGETGQGGEEGRSSGGVPEEKMEGIEETRMGEDKIRRPVETEKKTLIEGGEELSRIIDKLMDKVKSLEERIRVIEERITGIEKYIGKIRDSGYKNTIKTREVETKREEKGEKTLPIPVMSIPDARNKLGPLYDKLIYEGNIIEINNIVVDRRFYEEFIKKFPIPVKEAEKLSPLEKKLLDEMKKDARVILKAGQRYELVR